MTQHIRKQIPCYEVRFAYYDNGTRREIDCVKEFLGLNGAKLFYERIRAALQYPSNSVERVTATIRHKSESLGVPTRLIGVFSIGGVTPIYGRPHLDPLPSSMPLFDPLPPPIERPAWLDSDF